MKMTKPVCAPRTLKDLRKLASPLDLDCEALKLPEPPPSRRRIDDEKPVNPVTSLAELVAWCEAERINPAPAIGHALWSAVLMANPYAPRTVKTALTDRVFAGSARLRGKDRRHRPELVDVATEAQRLWQAAGRPFLDQAARGTQRHILGIRRAAARREADRIAVNG